MFFRQFIELLNDNHKNEFVDSNIRLTGNSPIDYVSNYILLYNCFILLIKICFKI